MRKLHGFLGSVLLLSLASGCAITPGRELADDVDTNPDCTGEGRLAIGVTGLPAGASAKITIANAAGSQTVERDAALTLPAGDYTITAEHVTQPDPIARTVFKGTVTRASVKVCSENAERVDIAYAPIATSNKVWMSNANGTAGILGYASSDVAATSSIPASIAAKTQGGKGIAFDKDGNLWAVGATVGDPTLVRYPASSLGASGEKTPDRKIDVANSGCSPFAVAIAFDPQGNLWLSGQCEESVMRLSPSDLETDGEKTASVRLGGLYAPRGLAFDGAGNLWVADDTTIRRFDASRLATSASDGGNATLTIANTPSEYIAFDTGGDLWSVGGSAENLSRIAKADLAAGGVRDVVPAVKISVGVTALPEGIAFDESGGLWIATSGGRFARIASAQLAVPSSYAAPTVPERTITSSDVGSAASIAIFPAPAGLPLYHSVR